MFFKRHIQWTTRLSHLYLKRETSFISVHAIYCTGMLDIFVSCMYTNAVDGGSDSGAVYYYVGYIIWVIII